MVWLAALLCIGVQHQKGKSFYGVFGSLNSFAFKENGPFWLVFNLKAKMKGVKRMQLEREKKLSIVVVC